MFGKKKKENLLSAQNLSPAQLFFLSLSPPAAQLPAHFLASARSAPSLVGADRWGPHVGLVPDLKPDSGLSPSPGAARAAAVSQARTHAKAAPGPL